MKTLMGKRLLALGAVGVLGLAACGGSDDVGSGDDAKDLLFNELIASMEEDGGSLEGIDQDCLRGVVDDIPDDQALLIANNLDAAEAPEGVDEETISNMTTGMFGCVDFGSLIDE